MMKVRFEIFFILFLAFALFMAGWWCGRREVQVQTITHIDTVYYEAPKEFSKKDREITLRVPRLLFANVDSSPSQMSSNDLHVAIVCDSALLGSSYANVENDSLQMIVTERTIEYQDSTYYARIVGPVVGPMAPRLDFIQTYNTTTVQTVTKKPRIAVTIGPNLSITPHGVDVGLGAQVGFVVWSK